MRKQKSKGNNRVGRCAAFVLLFLVFYLQPWFIGIAAGLSGVYALYATHRRWSVCSLHGFGFGKNESGAVALGIFVVALRRSIDLCSFRGMTAFSVALL